jgi:hypothetical protein
MPNSASAIVTAAEPISATFPARASKSGCRAANRNPNPLVARPGRGSGRRRRERRGQSAALRALDFGPVRAPDSRSATRARCGRDSEATADDRRAPAFLTDRTSLTPPPTSLPCPERRERAIGNGGQEFLCRAGSVACLPALHAAIAIA